MLCRSQLLLELGRKRQYMQGMSFIQNQPEYSVSEIAGHVKRMVEETFGYVRIRGEISKAGVNSASGHCYLTLKDDKAATIPVWFPPAQR